MNLLNGGKLLSYKYSSLILVTPLTPCFSLILVTDQVKHGGRGGRACGFSREEGGGVEGEWWRGEGEWWRGGEWWKGEGMVERGGKRSETQGEGEMHPVSHSASNRRQRRHRMLGKCRRCLRFDAE